MITLPKGSILKIGNKGAATLSPLSEHNRAAVSVTFERFETSNRMVDATLRKWHVADKRTWSTSWEGLPHANASTIDKAMGGEKLIEFYEAHPFEFDMEIRNPDGTHERVLVAFKDVEYSVTKRGAYEFWDVSISMEEV